MRTEYEVAKLPRTLISERLSAPAKFRPLVFSGHRTKSLVSGRDLAAGRFRFASRRRRRRRRRLRYAVESAVEVQLFKLGLQIVNALRL
jgi:hypothetical protein